MSSGMVLGKGVSDHDEPVPVVIDYHHNGIGDIVLGCWLVESAKTVGRKLKINCRAQREIPLLLGIAAENLTSAVSTNWPCSPGAQREFLDHPDDRNGLIRFDYWRKALGLPEMRPIRPEYRESSADAEWADGAWDSIDPTRAKKRILVFPKAAWNIRSWPLNYFMDVIDVLKESGYAVAAMVADKADTDNLNCHWWAGFSLACVAAMIRRADLVFANDSGPAHLAGTIGVRTLAVCGGSNGRMVFGHDSNVATISLGADELECAGCHYSYERGCRSACQVGCQALMLLRPDIVSNKVLEIVNGKPDL